MQRGISGQRYLVIISGRLHSDWKMVSSDRRLNITAGGQRRLAQGNSTRARGFGPAAPPSPQTGGLTPRRRCSQLCAAGKRTFATSPGPQVCICRRNRAFQMELGTFNMLDEWLAGGATRTNVRVHFALAISDRFDIDDDRL